MTFLAFLGALSLSVLAFELLNVFQSAFSTFGGNRLKQLHLAAPNQTPFHLGGVIDRHSAGSLRS